jgi:hypothetical protein
LTKARIEALERQLQTVKNIGSSEVKEVKMPELSEMIKTPVREPLDVKIGEPENQCTIDGKKGIYTG